MAVPLRIEHAGAVRSATEVASEASEQFFGSISRQRLLGLGGSRSQIAHWLAVGRLHPTRYPGVYAWGRPDLPEAGQLAAGLLYAGKGSALDGLSALWWQKLLPNRPPLIHIASPGRRSSCADLSIRHPRTINRHEHEGLPVVDFPSALLAAVPYLEFKAVRNVLARADFRDLLHLPSVQARCGSGQPGSKEVRAAMAVHLPQLARCANDFEIDFVLLCEARRLPIPEPNVRMGRYVPDMLWESRKLIVELDGKDAHSSPAQKHSDRTKQEWLEERGYRAERFNWVEVRFRQSYVVSRLGL